MQYGTKVARLLMMMTYALMRMAITLVRRTCYSISQERICKNAMHSSASER